MRKIYFLFFTSFVIFSCSEEVIITTEETVVPVVEAYLYANQSIDSIRITESISYYGDGTLLPIDDLSVIISYEKESITLESIGNGYYRSLESIVEEGYEYQIEFMYKDRTVSGSTYVQPSKEMSISQSSLELDQIEVGGGGFPGGGMPPGGGGMAVQSLVDVTWSNTELDYYFVDVQNIETDPEYVNTFLESLIEGDVDRPLRFFRSEPESTSFYSLDTRRELQYFGLYEITVYRLNPEYAALYETVGSSSLSLQEPPSNISNGLGIFTAVTPHKLYLEVVKI